MASLQRLWAGVLASLKKSKAAYGVLFMNTKAGFLLRAEGDNPAVVATLARDGGLVKIEGLIIANALVALSGAVMAQKE